MDFKPKATEVDLHKVQMDAEQAYKDGFFCCEAVLETIMNNFNLDVPHELIRMTSAMSIGAGRSGCLCGAISAIILIWLFIKFVTNFNSFVEELKNPIMGR